MAQLKRLTRAQKVLHSQVEQGQYPKAFNKADMKALENHGKVARKLVNGHMRWVAVEQEPPTVEQLNKLAETFNG